MLQGEFNPFITKFSEELVVVQLPLSLRDIVLWHRLGGALTVADIAELVVGPVRLRVLRVLATTAW